MPRVDHAAFVGRFALIVAATVGMLFVDTALAAVDRRETRSHARHLYSDADSLRRIGRLGDAVETLRMATSLDRSNPVNAIALSEALLSSNRPQRAREIIDGVLSMHGTSGPANLAMARTLIAQHDTTNAIVYFHRSIYGFWPGDGNTGRSEARLELISILTARNARQELLAELLPLEADSAPGLTRAQLAHLYLIAGSYGRSSAIYRDLLDGDSTSATAYAGLGEIALLTGNLQTAHADFMQALRLSPALPMAAALLARTDSIIAREKAGESPHFRNE